MSDKDKKKPSLLSSIRRSLVRPGSALAVEETRPILPGQARPSIHTKAPPRTSAKNFEISVRDKSDATAKRGFRVQVPKQILCYAVLVFVVAPLALFMYMEVHRVAASHGQTHQDKVPEDHLQHDVLSLLTDEDETDAAKNDAVVAHAGNATNVEGAANLNSTLLKQEGKEGSNGTDVVAADIGNKTSKTNAAEQIVVEAVQEAAADAEAGDHRRLRKTI